jgi:hypothetical protein
MATRRGHLIGALLPLGLVAVFAAAPSAERREGGASLPGPDANALWTYITRTNPYTSWQPLPGLKTALVQAKEIPHGDWVGVYANQAAVASIEQPSDPFQMSWGSILVKENYPSSPTPPAREQLLSLTVMYKVRGYQLVPGQEEWFWVMYTPKGGVQSVQGQPWVTGLGAAQTGPCRSKENPHGDWQCFTGEVLAGKPWLCLDCHQNARTPQPGVAFGDYVWNMKRFLATQKP